MAMPATEESPRIDVQRVMKKYPSEVRDLVGELVNMYGVRYKVIDGLHMHLLPPDGHSRPFKIAANRDMKQQVQIIHNQFIKRYMPEWRSEGRPVVVAQETPAEEPAAPEIVHSDSGAQVVGPGDTVTKTETVTIGGKQYQTEVEARRSLAEIKEDAREWRPHFTAKEGAPTPFVRRVNDEGVVEYRCQRCADEGKPEFLTTNTRLLGPHSGNHTEHKEKAVQTLRENKQKVAEAVVLIADTLGIEIKAKSKWTDEKVAALISEHEAERDRLAAERDEALDMAAELESQLAKIKAAFS